MKPWKSSKIGDLCKIKGGKRLPPGHSFSEQKTDFLYIRARDIKSGKINFQSPVYIDIDTREKIIRYTVEKGDVVLTIAGTIGETAIINSNLHGASLTENAVKLNAFSGVDPGFLLYFLLCPSTKDYFDLIASGSAQPKLGIYKIYNTVINYPSLAVQKKIASILSAYDDLIENNLKRIKLLEEKAQLTYEEWFVRMKYPGHESDVVDSETGLPEGWIKKALKDLGEIITGKTPSKTDQSNYEGEIPFIKTPDLGDFPYVLESVETLSQKGASLQRNKYVPKESLLVSCIGSAGQYSLTSKKSQFNQQINGIVFHKNVFTYFTYCFSKTLKDKLDAIGSNGATMTNVNKTKFSQIEIVVPTEHLLDQFHKIVSPCFSVILNLLNTNRNLTEARNLLLPRLMSGVIDIDEIKYNYPKETLA